MLNPEIGCGGWPTSSRLVEMFSALPPRIRSGLVRQAGSLPHERTGGTPILRIVFEQGEAAEDGGIAVEAGGFGGGGHEGVFLPAVVEDGAVAIIFVREWVTRGKVLKAAAAS